MSLTIEQATDLYDAFCSRRERWKQSESEHTSFMVAILNYGDRFTNVRCVGGEWTGIKNNLAPRDGIPLCPNGHPLMEYGPRLALGLVEEVQP